MQLSRREIFFILKDNLYCQPKEAFEKIENLVSTKSECPYKLTDYMKKICRNLIYLYRRKWRTVKKAQHEFFKKYDKWLNVTLSFYIPIVISETPAQSQFNCLSKFIRISASQKRRNTEAMSSRSDTIESSRVSKMRLRSSDKVNITKVATNITPENSKKDKNYESYSDSNMSMKISVDYALSLLLETKLSRNQYEVLRSVNIENNCNIYPSYKALLEAKEKCYPARTDIEIKDCSAEVKLQGLLDHTVEQILYIQRKHIKSSSSDYISNMKLFCKWGCSEIFTSESNSSISSISIVPLRLLSNNRRTKEEYIVWENQCLSSPRFCRPIKLQFYPENRDGWIKEVDYVKEQVKKLVSFVTVFDGKMINVSYDLTFIVTNSQVCHANNSVSSNQYCLLCNTVQEEFNVIEDILIRGVNENNYSFGLSISYIWVRFFECLLDLSYKLDIKKSEVTSETDKLTLENRKRNIQMGLNLQYGCTIDVENAKFKYINENTARCFFENSTTSALITGVDRIIIKRFNALLQAMSSNHKIHPQKFHDYALKTAERFVQLYSWYNMSITVHKILFHGPEIIQSALLPIGQLCNDVQQNLCIEKSYQDVFRVKNMEEVFLELLAISDPYISCLRELPQTKLKYLTKEATDLLSLTDILLINDNERMSDEDYDDMDYNE